MRCTAPMVTSFGTTRKTQYREAIIRTDTGTNRICSMRRIVLSRRSIEGSLLQDVIEDQHAGREKDGRETGGKSQQGSVGCESPPGQAEPRGLDAPQDDRRRGGKEEQRQHELAASRAHRHGGEQGPQGGE